MESSKCITSNEGGCIYAWLQQRCEARGSHRGKSSDSSRIVFEPKFEMKSLIKRKKVDGRMEREAGPIEISKTDTIRG